MSSTLLLLVSLIPDLATSQPFTLLSDDFNRADAAVLGNGWVEWEEAGGVVEISANQLSFTQTADLALRPMVTHGFAEVVGGVVEWTFELEWSRTGSERAYAVHMQLGDGAQMSAQSIDAGVGVNLFWGRIGGVHEQLGYRRPGSLTALSGVSGRVSLRVRADLDNFSYAVEVDGTLVGSQLPFDSAVALNTVRFFTDGLNDANFSGQAFDALDIRGR